MTTSPRPTTPLRQRMIEDMKLRNLSSHTVQAASQGQGGFAGADPVNGLGTPRIKWVSSVPTKNRKTDLTPRSTPDLTPRSTLGLDPAKHSDPAKPSGFAAACSRGP
jgi:hypothetical protein